MMYGERRFMQFLVDILIVLYIFGFGTARLGEWRLNDIHSINGAEVINASVSDSSAEIDYRWGCLSCASPPPFSVRMRVPGKIRGVALWNPTVANGGNIITNCKSLFYPNTSQCTDG